MIYEEIVFLFHFVLIPVDCRGPFSYNATNAMNTKCCTHTVFDFYVTCTEIDYVLNLKPFFSVSEKISQFLKTL